MRPFVLIALAMAIAACGKQIGDSCIVSSDCSPNGDRFCESDWPSGYCTIQGCDYNTCPSEAVCVRFFMGSFQNKPCDPATEGITTHACTLDEVCTLQGQCTPRDAQVLDCMKKCSSNSDCRSGYECRDIAKMKRDGGEPVLAPKCDSNGQNCVPTPVDSHAPKFCAPAPAS